MKTSFIRPRVGGTHGLWVFFPTVLFLHYARFIYDGREHFCSASSSREVWPQEVAGKATDSASLASSDIFRISLQRRHLDPSSSPDEKENFLFLHDILAPQTRLLSNEARIDRPHPVASIPACVKPHVESLLKYAFDVLVYNQQRYLLTRREEKTDRPGAEQTGRKEGERKEGLEEGKGDDSGEDRMKLLGEEVPVPLDAEQYHREGLAEYTKMCILLSLMSRVGKSPRLPGVSEWTRANASTDNRGEDLERLPVYSSSLGPSSTQDDWERAYARLFSQLKGSLRENNELVSTEEASGLYPLSHDTTILRDLHKNRQVEELAALLPEVGRTSLPNEPEKADVYLSLLIADEESMGLWRSHIVRHVFEHFTFASCRPENAAVTSAAAPMEAKAATQTDAARRKNEPAERPVEGEGLGPEAEQKGRRRTDSFSRLSAAPKDSNVDSSSVHGLRTAHDGSTGGRVEEGEVHPAGGEDAIHRKQEGGSRRIAKGSSIWHEGLLNANWNGVHDLLLRELQRQFWMARPATSAAAVHMIQMTREWQQQQEQHRQGDGGQQEENLERGRPGRGQQQTQREEKHLQQNEEEQQESGEKKDADVDKLLTKEERGRSSSNKGKGAAVGGAPWEAEVSIRFRFVSMKDAQRMMGTFLTSNLHPEMGFPTGTKLPPKSRSTSSRRSTAGGGAATGNGEEEEEKIQGDAGTGGPREARGTEQDEGEEQQVPDHFDARHAFPACKEVIGHVRDQGNCGSCWAFSATTAFNDRLCIRSGGEMQQLLSTQHTTSCCDPLRCASYGCKGGEPGFAWRWFSRSGVVSGGDYDTLHTGKTCWPYELPFCNHNAKGPFPDCDKSSGYVETPVCRSECEEPEYTKNVHPFSQDLHYAARTYSFPTPMHAKKDIMRSGSISASFMVYEDLLTYKSGVYKHVYGLPLGGHSVKAIGWGVEGGEKYWLLVNSWNTYWGENGLVKFRMGDAGINDDLVAGDAVWKPHADHLPRDMKPNDASSLPAEDSNVHTYREL